jgi:hypothetical protein
MLMDEELYKKGFKILSIDGGGIKGLYSSKILEHLEDEVKSPLSDYFDLITGTSTGGLISMALSLKIPAKEIVNFYKTEGPLIFKNKLPFSRRLRFFQQLLIQSKYSAKQLKSSLEKIFDDKKISDSDNLLCIPSFNATTGANRVFKYDHEKLIGTDNDLTMVDVGLATAAAPTYFPLHKIGNPYFVDGGVWANNPALCGLLEAMKFFVGPSKQYDSVKILSIASLNNGSGFQIRKNKFNPIDYIFDYKRLSFRNWNSKLFQITLDGQSEFIDFFLRSISSDLSFGCSYCRIPPHKVDPRNVSFIDLDMASERSLELLEEYGNRQGLIYRRDSSVSNFFLSKKTFHLKK